MPKELEIRFVFDSLRVHVVRRQLTFLTDILAGVESHLRVARYRATRPLLTKPAGGGARGTSAERSWRPFWWYAYRCVQLDLQLRRSKRGWPAAQHHSLVALQYLALRKQLSGVLHSKTFFTFETEHEHVNESIEGVPDSEDLRPATQRDLEVAASVLSCRPRCFALRSLCLRSPEGSEGEGAPGTPSLADLETLAALHRVQLEFDCTLPILTAISMRLLAVNRGDFVPRRPVPATEPQDGADGTVTTPEPTAAGVTQPLTATVQTPIRSGTLTITLAELAGVKDSGVGLAKPVVSAWIGGQEAEPGAAPARETRVGVRSKGRKPLHLYLDTFTFTIHGATGDERGEHPCEDFVHVSCRDAGATLFDCELGHARIAMHELTAQPGNEFELRLSEASYWRKPDPVLKVFTHFHLDGRAAPPPQEPSSSLDVLQLRQPGMYEASAAQLEHIDHDQSFAPSGKKGATAATNGASRTATTNEQGKVQLSIKAHIPILRLHIHRPAATIAKQKVAAKAAAQQAIKRHSFKQTLALADGAGNGAGDGADDGKGAGVGADEAASAGEGASAGVGASASAGAGDEAADGVAREWRKGLAATRAGTTLAMHVTVERLLIDIEDLKTSFSVSKRMQGDLTLGELRVSEYRSDGSIMNAAALKKATIHLEGVRFSRPQCVYPLSPQV